MGGRRFLSSSKLGGLPLKPTFTTTISTITALIANAIAAAKAGLGIVNGDQSREALNIMPTRD
jgi:hypothetical protein